MHGSIQLSILRAAPWALAAPLAIAQTTLFEHVETEPGAEAGSAVALWDDLDGDGTVEWCVGAPRKDVAAGGDAGQVTVLSGSTGMPLFTLDGTIGSGLFGDSLANAGDLDGDGIDELAVGARGEKIVRVYSGATQALWWSHPEPGRPGFGAAVARAGDVNGDGTGDVIVGAPTHGSIVVLSGLDGTTIFSKQPSGLSLFGFSVASAGDIDGDGFDDVLAGAPQTFNVLYNEGAVVVMRGPLGDVAHTHRPSSVQDRGQEFGYSVAPAGDVDGDGLSDYAVGARYYGALHFIDYNFVAVFSGVTHLELRRVEGGFDQWFGESLASAGDIDLDGHADLAIGNPLGNEVVVWSPHRDVVVTRFTGPGFEDAGGSVAGGKDVDGDGFLDLVQGTPYVNFGSLGPGRATVMTLGCRPDAAFNYCGTSPNAGSPVGATIGMLGSTSLSSSGMRLFATDCPPGTIALFIHGTETASSPSGFGRLCVGGNILRLYPASPTGLSGTPSYNLSLAGFGAQIGEARFFQCWMRDNQAGAVGHNFSDGLRVTFCP